MPVKGSINPAVDKDRVRYYKARADRIEMENGLARAQYVEADRIRKDLGEFCDAIARKIRASDLDPGLKAEIGEDLNAYLGRIHLPVTGPNGQHKGRQPHGRKAKNLKTKAK
jgi:hypothetical protein